MCIFGADEHLQEYQRGTEVNDPDTDNDGRSDGDEVASGRNPKLNEGAAVLPAILQLLFD